MLCENCKYDIIYDTFDACLNCIKQPAGVSGLCGRCRVPYDRAWCIADRAGNLRELIDGYKFQNTRAAHLPLAELLASRLPDLPPETVVVPVPTLASHIRQRGYDHMYLIARRLGRLRKLPTATPLVRVTATTQRGANARQRRQQAEEAFACRGQLDPDKIYLLIDDVVTSGSTVKYAAKTLKDAGAQKVWVAAISHQPLD